MVEKSDQHFESNESKRGQTKNDNEAFSLPNIDVKNYEIDTYVNFLTEFSFFIYSKLN